MSQPTPHDPIPTLRSTLFAATAGTFVGGFGYLAAMVLTIASAPRQLEHVIRQVVTMPWPVYAWIPTVAAIAVLLISACSIRGQSRRLVFLIFGAMSLAFFAHHGIDLLRRDYIGKF